MPSTLAFASAILASAHASPPEQPCRGLVFAEAQATRLSELPDEIRANLLVRLGSDLADSDEPIRQSDVITSENEMLPTVRFVHGLLVRGIWYVSYEPSMMTPRTMGYFQTNGTGTFMPSFAIFLGGPPCAAIQASLSGVHYPGLPLVARSQ